MGMRCRSFASCLLILILQGCAETADDPPSFGERGNDRVTGALEEFSNYGISQPGLQEDAQRNRRANKSRPMLPDNLMQDDTIYLAVRGRQSVPAILHRLEDLTGIPHAFYSGPEQELMTGHRSPVGENQANSGEHRTGENEQALEVYSGSLEDVLDRIASQHDLGWEFTGEQIVFREFITRLYHLPLMPKRFTSSRTLGSVNMSTDLDPSAEIMEVITRIIGPGARYAYSSGTGILMVMARPGEHVRIAQHVGRIEHELEQQMAFDIHVLTVSDTRSSGAATRFSLDLLGKAGHINWSANNSLVDSGDTFNVGIARGDFNLDAVVTALNHHGKVSVETRTGATTSNNQIVPIQVVRETAYVKQVSTVPDSDGKLQTSLEPGSLTTGFEMVLHPRILGGHRVLLDYSIKVSELNRLEEFTTELHSIQLPSVSTTLFEQQAILGDGETLVLAGFERGRSTADTNRSFLFASKKSDAVDRVATVILIRSRILGRGLSAGSSDGE